MKAQEHWTTENKSYGIYINDLAWGQMLQACLRAQQNETGGIVIGYYANDQQTAIVTQVSIPTSDSKSGRYWFKRGVVGLKALLKKCWKASRKTYYLGEWHYHPLSEISPSSEDFHQMVMIRKDQSFQCKEPIMIIAGKSRETKIHARAWIFPDDELPLEFDLES